MKKKIHGALAIRAFECFLLVLVKKRTAASPVPDSPRAAIIMLGFSFMNDSLLLLFLGREKD